MFGDIAKMMEQLPKLDALFAQVSAIANEMLARQKDIQAEQDRHGKILNLLCEKHGVEIPKEW